jgi:type I restriction enzyme R subunit
MTSPEQRAREKIDELLDAAGWQVQDYHELSLTAARGVAVREFPLKTGFADYLLFVDCKAIGAVEAKAVGTPLSGVERQSEKYSVGLPDIPPAWHKPLPFLYESTGIETFFTNGLDPEPRSRRVFAFHQPATLAEWASESETAPGSEICHHSSARVFGTHKLRRSRISSVPSRKTVRVPSSRWRLAVARPLRLSVSSTA